MRLYTKLCELLWGASTVAKVSTARAQRAFDAPAKSIQPYAYGRHRNASEPRPFSYRSRLTIPRQVSVRATVVGLLYLRRPSHIAGLVVSVDVNSVERVLSGGTRTKVGEELAEISTPLRIHGDSTTTVAGPTLIERVKASLDCTPVAMIFRRAVHAVCSFARRRKLAVKAPATFSLSLRQSTTNHPRHTAAVTLAAPSLAAVRVLNRYKATEALAGQVDQRTAHLLTNYTRSGLLAH